MARHSKQNEPARRRIGESVNRRDGEPATSPTHHFPVSPIQSRRTWLKRSALLLPALFAIGRARADVIGAGPIMRPTASTGGLTSDSDNFTYSDGKLSTLSSGKWTDCTITGGNPGVQVVSGAIHNGGNENAVMITTWPGSTTKQYSEVVYGSGQFGGPTIFNDGVGTFYVADFHTDGVYLYKVIAADFGTSLAISAGAPIAGHTYRLRVQTPGTVVVSDNGSDIITVSDSGITTGKPGLRCWSATFDNWAAGDF